MLSIHCYTVKGCKKFFSFPILYFVPKHPSPGTLLEDCSIVTNGIIKRVILQKKEGLLLVCLESELLLLLLSFAFDVGPKNSYDSNVFRSQASSRDTGAGKDYNSTL